MTADRKTLTTHVTLSKRTIPKPLASSKEKNAQKMDDGRRRGRMEYIVEEGEIEFAKKEASHYLSLLIKQST